MMDELYSKFVGALWGMLLCMMVSMLTGCGAKKPAVLTRTDSMRVTKVAKDTVYWDRIVLRYVERAKTDKTVNRDSTATTVDEVGKEHREAHRVLHRCHNNRRCASADSQICERKAEEQREERIKGNCLDY